MAASKLPNKEVEMVRIVRTEGLPIEARTEEMYGWATAEVESEMPSACSPSIRRMLEKTMERRLQGNRGERESNK